MKHQVCALFLFASFSLCAEVDKHTIADKSKRIGRFSYEDSFDENVVDGILKHSPASVKKNIKRLLYPSADEEALQRLLLLGGTSNASTTAIAKTIALHCGYEYYVIDAAALLREYREGRQMLLTEVRPIIKSGKPIALIITELPEMADYSGLLASTLWLLIDQCAQYQDVLVIATSAFERVQLSEDVKERFGENIIPIVLDKSMQDRIEIVANKTSWLERNKTACIVAGGVACFILAAVNIGAQILFAKTQLEKQEAVLLMQEKQNDMLKQSFDLQNKLMNFVENKDRAEKQAAEKLQKDKTIMKTVGTVVGGLLVSSVLGFPVPIPTVLTVL